MSLALRIVGGLAILIGSVWALQGLSILPGNLMRGQTQWIINGLGMIALGAGLYWWGLKARTR